MTNPIERALEQADKITEANAHLESISVSLDPTTRAFYAGVYAGSQVAEAHAALPMPDHATRLAFFYLYCGALGANRGHGDHLDHFILGAKTREPEAPSSEDSGT